MHDLIYLLLEIRRAVCSAEEPDIVPGGEVFVKRRTLGHVSNPLPQHGPVLERVQPHHPRRAAGGSKSFDAAVSLGQSGDLYGIHPLTSFPSRPRKKMPTTASMCSSSVRPSSLMVAKNILPPAWGRSIPINALALALTSCGLSLPSST